MFGSHIPYENQVISRILNNISCVNFKLGDTDTAFSNLAKSHTIQQKLMGYTTKEESPLLSIAYIQSNIGHIRLTQNRRDAIVLLYEARLVSSYFISVILTFFCFLPKAQYIYCNLLTFSTDSSVFLWRQ